jgi:hypothetical protein
MGIILAAAIQEFIVNQPRNLMFALLFLFFIAGCRTEVNLEPTPIPPPPTITPGADAAAAPTRIAAEALTTPTAGPDNPVADATPMAIPSQEPTVAPSASPIPPPISGATAPVITLQPGDPLPPISRDLLFLADGSLKRWSAANGRIETLIPSSAGDRTPPEDAFSPHIPGDITSFVVNDDGKRAAASRLIAQDLLSEENRQIPLFRYEILYIDLVSLMQWQLVPQATSLTSMALSPDGMQFAFIADNVNGQIPDLFDGEADAHLYYLPTAGGTGGPLQELAPCVLFCSTPLWHLENNLLSWGDGEGLWFFNINAAAPEIFLQNRSGVNPETTLVYTPNSWASNGRALLLNKGGWESTAFTIFDVPTGNLIDIPDSRISYGPFPSAFNWMPDGRILALRAGSVDGSTPRQLELYRPNLETGTITREEVVVIAPAAQFAALQSAIPLLDGRFAFALSSWGEAPDPAAIGLYHLTSFNETPQKVNGLPITTIADRAFIAWSNHGEHAILAYSFTDEVYFAQANGDELFEMQAVFGHDTNVTAFTWLPELVIP